MEGTASEGIEGVAVRVLAPLEAGPDDVRAADLVVLAAPPNLGMINGLMKDFLERIYYPCLDETVGRPCALRFKGDTDATGALANTEKILAGLQWRQVQPPFIVIGDITDDDRARAAELARRSRVDCRSGSGDRPGGGDCGAAKRAAVTSSPMARFSFALRPKCDLRPRDRVGAGRGVRERGLLAAPPARPTPELQP